MIVSSVCLLSFIPHPENSYFETYLQLILTPVTVFCSSFFIFINQSIMSSSHSFLRFMYRVTNIAQHSQGHICYPILQKEKHKRLKNSSCLDSNVIAKYLLQSTVYLFLADRATTCSILNMYVHPRAKKKKKENGPCRFFQCFTITTLIELMNELK